MEGVLKRHQPTILKISKCWNPCFRSWTDQTITDRFGSIGLIGPGSTEEDLKKELDANGDYPIGNITDRCFTFTVEFGNEEHADSLVVDLTTLDKIPHTVYKKSGTTVEITALETSDTYELLDAHKNCEVYHTMHGYKCVPIYK